MGLFDPGPELFLLLIIIVVLLFGSTKIPELARALGRAMGEFKRGRMEIERELQESYGKSATVDESPVRKAAGALNISTKDMSDVDLKQEVIGAVELASRKGVVAVAKALGLDVEGIGADELKKQISDKLASVI